VELATFGKITGKFLAQQSSTFRYQDLQRRCDVEPPGCESGNTEHTWGMYNKPTGCSTPVYGAPHKQTKNMDNLLVWKFK
jgi:hypothetical protein